MTNTLKFSLFSFFLSFNWISFKAQSQSLKFELEIAKPSSGEILKKGNWMISVKDKNGLIILQEVVPFKNRKQLCELQVPEFGIYSASFYLDLNLNKTLDALRRFTEVEKLSNIKFGEFTNRVRIANKMIIIPEMTLENSALTLKVEGTNSFDGKMNFLIQMQLRELIGNKKTIRSKRLDDFIKEKNNQEKVWIPLRMNGYPENIKFSIDTKKIGDDVKLNIKNDWKKQSEDIKSLFNNKKKDKKEETEYEFIWEEEPDTNRSFIQLDRSFNESL